ncbi:ABC transporter ATP-binding protein [Acidisoma cellulosilytica]|uniref:ABC transporter ATP-binding protein n=1 Tax=Acidisoma cellulosilyticum TaxID=2802395 RepID=A0A963Z5Z4_9PROT|nr:ABC transporter ATP-binding protein [Acidisoma cellulosilyticum]MCB8883179.1 ABC transporter ATP-binding protein [Acidisoma cellulosilyticum]
MNGPLVNVTDLRVEFPSLTGPDVAVISGLDLAIEPGQVVGLVGEAGAGKTVLARSIMQMVPEPGRVTKGRAELQGEDLLTMSERRLQRVRGARISMITANPRGELNPLLPVGEQIATMARVHLGQGRKESRETARAMLRKVQISDPDRRYAAYPHELSGGMAQRIVIAIALVCGPQVVIADDATSGLDVTVQAQILMLLRDLAREQNSSMLLITRDVGITAHVCDRIAVMHQGEIVEAGDRQAVFLRPAHPYTIMLLAAFSHNKRLRALWSHADADKAAPARGEQACSYVGRCPLAQARCRAEKPMLRMIAPGHEARCHFPVVR